MDKKLMSHFCVFSMTPAFWEMSGQEKDELLKEWFERLNLKDQECATWFYQVFPTKVDSDILVWNTVVAEDKQAMFNFNRKFAENVNPYRLYVEPVQSLWGMTKPSMYSKRKSTSDQEMKPFADKREPYLIVYPFTKTAEWYLKSREARQGMMNEHIKTGKEFPEITQLLLYSFGLQDDEFVVVYETQDASKFSDLVYDLRATEARAYTANDLPIITATNHKPDELRKIMAAE